MNITADDILADIYCDGCQLNLSNLKNARIWSVADTVSLPLATSVLAVHVVNDKDSVGRLLASSAYFVTDGSWKVSNTLENGWTDVDFDDSLWQNASVAPVDGGGIDGIDGNVMWINTDDADAVDFFFRYRMKRGSA